ncbi:hypothetical protein [Heyndrickxia camelliae]|uniref:Uncharacterized protein n=1 Tax=Heyndrickxia camelliae TaxID=1707093 RepID=A0A2N3LD02_9BACI|nr:hypothetical protein [Heyndrickxia camelliae]PKR82498.1 hypothetical protein CWO92_24160 [Heyndrickxia camelliae]
MIAQLKEMNEDLKKFLSKKIFEERTGIENEIINDALIHGFKEQDALNGLHIFLNNELITKPLNAPIPGLNKDFLINDSKFAELKAKGYL